MSALDEYLKKHRKKIIDREKKTFRELLAAYQDIERELAAQFDDLQEKIKSAQANGEEISLSWFYREKRLKNLLSQVTEQIIRFGEKTAKIVEREQREAIKIAAVQTKETFEILTENAPDVRSLGSMLNPRAVETAVGIMGDGSPIIEYFQKQLAPMVAERIKSEVIKASAIGTDFKTIGKRLEETGGITKHRALSCARTEVNRVRLLFLLETYKKLGISKYQRICNKQTTTCILCLALDGTIYDVSEIMPTHLNCRCLVIPFFPTIKRQTAQEWFLNLSQEKQREILGIRYFELWLERNFNLKDLIKYRRHEKIGERIFKKPIAEFLG